MSMREGLQHTRPKVQLNPFANIHKYFDQVLREQLEFDFLQGFDLCGLGGLHGASAMALMAMWFLVLCACKTFKKIRTIVEDHTSSEGQNLLIA